MTGTPDFNVIKQTNIYGEDYWSVRDLMPLLDYGKKWQNFESVIKKAMPVCSPEGSSLKNTLLTWIMPCRPITL